MTFLWHTQENTNDCAAACLKIIAEFYNRKYSIDELKIICHTTKDGTTIANLLTGLEQIGFKALAIKVEFQIFLGIPLPAIIHTGNHFVVVYKISKKYIYTSDPARGLIKYRHSVFVNKVKFHMTSSSEIIAIIFQLT